MIRHPLAMAESIYFQRLKNRQIRADTPPDQRGRYFDFAYWMDRIWSSDEERMKGSIDYAATIQIYAELFGKSSLGVFVYEDLVENPKAFIRRVCEFVGIDPEQAIDSVAGKRENVRWTRSQIDRLKKIEDSTIRSSFNPEISVRVSSPEPLSQQYSRNGAESASNPARVFRR